MLTMRANEYLRQSWPIAARQRPAVRIKLGRRADTIVAADFNHLIR